MAVTIKLKNASGSDPNASDLVLGELAIRTDTAKLFTKKDNGSVVEILGSTGGGLTNGDKGDITVANNGDTLTVDNGVINNAKVASDAAIAGSKISPNFGSQNVVTTGTLGSGDITITDASPSLNFSETGADPDYKIVVNSGKFRVYDTTNGADRFVVNTDGHIDIAGNTDFGAGIDVTGDITGSSNLTGVKSIQASGHVAIDGTPHTYKYGRGGEAGGLSIYATEGAIEAVGSESSTHAASLLLRTTVDGAGFVYNPTDNALELKLFTTSANNFAIHGSGTNVSDIDTQLRVVKDAQVELAHNGSVKLATSSSGIDITGSIVVSGTVDGIDILAFHTQAQSFFNNNNSGVLTNGVTATTQSAGDNSTKVATTAYTDTAISNLVDSSPSTLNTLNELAAALGDDANFSTTVTNSIATKLPLAGGTLTGNLTISNTEPKLFLTDTNNNDDYSIQNQNGYFAVKDESDGQNRLVIHPDGTAVIGGNLDVGAGLDVTGNITVTGTVDGRDVASDGSKLDGIESGATADQTASDIKTLLNSSGLVNAQIDASAAIAGTKISPDFGSQNIITTGSLASGNQVITADAPSITFTDSNNNPDYQVKVDLGAFVIKDQTAQANRFTIDSSKIVSTINHDFSSGIDVTGAITGTGNLTITRPVNTNNTLTLGGSGAYSTFIKLLCAGAGGTQIEASGRSDGGNQLEIKIGSNVVGIFKESNFNVRGNILLTGDATTTNQDRTIQFTGFDKEGTTDFTDNALIRHTTNTQGLTGSVLLLQSLNDSNDGIAFYTSNHNNNLRLNSNIIWNAGNDGSGSGLDSDTVDGIQASSFVRGDGVDNGATTIEVNDADFIVQDTTDSITNFIWRDHSGNKFYIGTANAVVTPRSHIIPQADSTYNLGADATRWANIYADTLYGDGSNLTNLPSQTDQNFTNADHSKLDGIESGATADQSASEILTLIKTVDGTGSGLDADTVDGIQGANLLRSNANDTSSGTVAFGVGTLDPDSFASHSGGFGGINDAGWAARGVFVHGGGTGDAAAMAHNGSKLYFGIQNGSSTNSMATWLDVTPGTRVINFQTADNANNVQIGGNKIFHAGNDGSGSGLDADTVDGIQASSFLRSDAADTASQTITFSGGINVGDNANGGITGSNYNITGVNQITMNDPGEGIVFKSGIELLLIDDSNDNILNFNGAAELRVNNSKVWTASNDGTGSGLDADTVDGIQASNFLRSDGNDTITGTLTIGDGSGQHELHLKKADNNTSDHLIFFNGTTRIGEIGCEDDTWLRINQETDKNIYTPRYIRADNGFFVDGTSKGINGSGNFIGGTIAGASDYGTLVRSNASDTLTGGTYTFDSSTDQKIILQGSNNPYIRFKQGTTEKAYIQWNDTHNCLRIRNQEDDSELRIKDGLQFSLDASTFYTVWHSGNDGSGSGLNADTLDGVQGSSYLRSDANDTVSSNLNFTSTSTPITTNAVKLNNSENSTSYYTEASGILAFDENFYSDSNYGTGATSPMSTFTSNGGGLVIKNEDGWGAVLSSTNIQWCEGNFANLKINSNQVFHAGNDGSGSGLDADTLDGVQGSSFLRSDAADSATGTLTVRDIKFSAGYHLQRSDHHSGHLEGSYNNVGNNSTKTNPIYTIGSAYNPNDAALSNMYGIGYTHATNASFISKTGAGNWGMYVAADGDARVWLGGDNGVVSSSGQHYVGSNVVWNAGNDGAGSGLDADTLDGVQGTNYAQKTGATCTGDFSFAGGAGAVLIAANSDIRLNNGTWTGDYAGKIQHHSNNIYIQYPDNGTFRVRDSAGNDNLTLDSSGNLTAVGDVTAYSDINLKTNIKTIDNALNMCNQMRGVFFDWKASGDSSIGVIAQEIEKVIPQIVHTNENTDPLTGVVETIKSVDYGKVTSVLINAINELTQKVKELENKLNVE